MAWRDSAADLPTPRDDEPAHLRQDILDELADHLQSALERELHQTPDQESARQQVLTRFGDPRAVARKLWFDAMWEKIMSQRIQLAVSVLTLLACVGLFTMSWMIAQQGRSVNEALLTEMREARKAMTELASREQPGLKPVRFHLVTESGAPLPEGFVARLDSGAKSFNYSEKPNRDGVVDFGFVPAGNCELCITSPWGNGEEFHQSVSVRIGREINETIVCPSGPPPEIEGQFGFAWPAKPQHDEHWLIAKIRRGRRAGNDAWTPEQNPWAYVLIDPQGSTYPVFEKSQLETQLGGVFASSHFVHLDRTKLGKAERVSFSPERVVAWRLLERIVRENSSGDEMILRAGKLCNTAELLQTRAKEVNHWRLALPEELLQSLEKKEAQAAKPAPVTQPKVTLATENVRPAQPKNTHPTQPLLVRTATPAASAPRPVRVRLVTETGAPLPEGFKAKISRGNEYDYRNEPNHEGVVDFDPVRPASTTLTVTTPWGEKMIQNLVFSGDEGIDERIMCPDTPPEKCQGEFEFEWPKELKAKNLWLAAKVVSGRREAGRVWATSEAVLLLDPNGQRTHVSVSLRSSSPSFASMVPHLFGQKDGPILRIPLPIGASDLDDLAPVLITNLAVLRPTGDAKPGSNVREFQRLAWPESTNQSLVCHREERNVWRPEFREMFKVQVLRVLDGESDGNATKLTDRSKLLVPR